MRDPDESVNVSSPTDEEEDNAPSGGVGEATESGSSEPDSSAVGGDEAGAQSDDSTTEPASSTTSPEEEAFGDLSSLDALAASYGIGTQSLISGKPDEVPERDISPYEDQLAEQVPALAGQSNYLDELNAKWSDEIAAQSRLGMAPTGAKPSTDPEVLGAKVRAARPGQYETARVGELFIGKNPDELQAFSNQLDTEISQRIDNAIAEKRSQLEEMQQRGQQLLTDVRAPLGPSHPLADMGMQAMWSQDDIARGIERELGKVSKGLGMLENGRSLYPTSLENLLYNDTKLSAQPRSQALQTSINSLSQLLDEGFGVEEAGYYNERGYSLPEQVQATQTNWQDVVGLLSLGDGFPGRALAATRGLAAIAKPDLGAALQMNNLSKGLAFGGPLGAALSAVGLMTGTAPLVSLGQVLTSNMLTGPAAMISRGIATQGIPAVDASKLSGPGLVEGYSTSDKGTDLAQADPVVLNQTGVVANSGSAEPISQAIAQPYNPISLSVNTGLGRLNLKKLKPVNPVTFDEHVSWLGG